jgi:hypothetical protein
MREIKDSPSYMKQGTVHRGFFDPTPDQQNVGLVDAATLRKAESANHASSNSEGAEIP